MEVSRRNQLTDTTFSDRGLIGSTYFKTDSTASAFQLELLPLYLLSKFNNKRPYGINDYLLIPGVGFQQYASTGVFAKWKFLTLQLQPELAFSQNSSYQGFPGTFSSSIIRDRFAVWNLGDYPERFGEKSFAKIWWGQSKLTAQLGAFEIGASTQNIWWGPGQWNSLTFSNSAQSFPYLTFNTTKPAKTFLGTFEVQLMSGLLNTARQPPSQSDSLNIRYYRPIRDKNRYLNALMVSYSPKWIEGLHVGATRTVHTFTDSISSNFIDIFPVFWGITKEAIGSDLIGESDKGRSQQITIFARYVFTKAKAEIYFEFGRRDHALNWKEFILNPEHARAYILGFNKLVRIEQTNLLLRGEMTQQQESINRYIRYLGLKGGSSWHTNGSIGGFTHHGQPLGVGIGTGSNVQTLEVSLVDGMDKMGIVFERLANNQDFYYKALLQNTQRRPWIDLSLGFLYDKKFDNLLVSSKLQVIHARNYKWQLDPASSPEFPKGENLTSVMGQVSLIYFWKKE